MLALSACRQFCVVTAEVPPGEYNVAEVAQMAM